MFNVTVTVNLPGGTTTQTKAYASLGEAEAGMIDLIEGLGCEFYDVAPHGFESITAVITTAGQVVETLNYTLAMFEAAHAGKVIKMVPCRCWLTVGAGKWQSSGFHGGCEKQVQTNFQL